MENSIYETGAKYITRLNKELIKPFEEIENERIIQLRKKLDSGTDIRHFSEEDKLFICRKCHKGNLTILDGYKISFEDVMKEYYVEMYDDFKDMGNFLVNYEKIFAINKYSLLKKLPNILLNHTNNFHVRIVEIKNNNQYLNEEYPTYKNQIVIEKIISRYNLPDNYADLFAAVYLFIKRKGIVYREESDIKISDFVQNVINDYININYSNLELTDTEQERVFKQYYLRYILSDKDYDRFIEQLEYQLWTNRISPENQSSLI